MADNELHDYKIRRALRFAATRRAIQMLEAVMTELEGGTPKAATLVPALIALGETPEGVVDDLQVLHDAAVYAAREFQEHAGMAGIVVVVVHRHPGDGEEEGDDGQE